MGTAHGDRLSIRQPVAGASRQSVAYVGTTYPYSEARQRGKSKILSNKSRALSERARGVVCFLLTLTYMEVGNPEITSCFRVARDSTSLLNWPIHVVSVHASQQLKSDGIATGSGGVAGRNVISWSLFLGVRNAG
jgi:hypothetical protein